MDESPQTQEEKSSQPLSPLKQIRTFQGDVASVLQNQKESIYSIQETERLKRASGGTVIDTTPKDAHRGQFALLLLGTFLLIALGAFGAWFAYREYLNKTAPPIVETPQSQFITPQSSVVINAKGITRDKLIQAIFDNSSNLSSSELQNLVLETDTTTAGLMTTAQFFSTLQSRAPGNLVRALDPTFMLGSLGDHRFLIFKLLSYENAFGGMLNWESNMTDDIGPLFLTAPLLQSIPASSVFKDTVSKNKDLRVLYAPVDASGTTTAPVLLYSFFDSKMLIITDDVETMHTLTNRLTAELLVH